MDHGKVYELFGQRSSFFRDSMSRRGYFEKESQHLKVTKIKILGRSCEEMDSHEVTISIIGNSLILQIIYQANLLEQNLTRNI